jgi:hypothetical protein
MRGSGHRPRWPGGLFEVPPNPSLDETEITGPPRFLGSPLHVRPALRPRSDLGASPYRRFGAAPAYNDDEGSNGYSLTRLNHTAFVLPVYASQPGSPPNHATLGSGYWLGFAGWVLPPLGSSVRFLCDSRHGVPLTQAFLAHRRDELAVGPGSRRVLA